MVCWFVCCYGFLQVTSNIIIFPINLFNNTCQGLLKKQSLSRLILLSLLSIIAEMFLIILVYEMHASNLSYSLVFCFVRASIFQFSDILNTFLNFVCCLSLLLRFSPGDVWHHCEEISYVLDELTSISSVLLFWWYIHFKLQTPHAKSKKVEAWKSNPMDDKWWFGYFVSKL